MQETYKVEITMYNRGGIVISPMVHLDSRILCTDMMTGRCPYEGSATAQPLSAGIAALWVRSQRAHAREVHVMNCSALLPTDEAPLSFVRHVHVNLLQARVKFESTEENLSHQPLFICNMHGSDIVNFFQVREDRDSELISPDTCAYLSTHFDQNGHALERLAFDSVSALERGEEGVEGKRPHQHSCRYSLCMCTLELESPFACRFP
jgi:hypothetical protein